LTSCAFTLKERLLGQQPLYTAAETRELDRLAIEEAGIPGIRLMSRAGRAAFERLQELWPEATQLHVFCGSGNNGGDGYIVASLAQTRGMAVTVYQVGEPAKLSGDALAAHNQALSDGVHMRAFQPGESFSQGIVVDAVLGTGLSGVVRDDAGIAIDAINASALPVLAIDIPSGLCSDSGKVLGRAVVANHCITFIGIKRGLLTGAAATYVGGLSFTDLDVPIEVYQAVDGRCFCLELEDQLQLLPARQGHAHKGMFGHVLIVGGDVGMAGAALMAAEAAARCGAGLVSAATRPEHVAPFVARRPELMTRGLTHGSELLPMLDKPNAVAVGPGLGTSAWSEQMLQRVTDTSLPLVMDADALNLLSQGTGVTGVFRDNWILTPHPGEAARLLEVSTADIQADRFAAVQALQQRYGGVVVLKGAGTLICGGAEVYLSPYGNPGMASGGMGDVLSGVLAALLAQGLAPLPAACLGVCLHGRAADLASVDGAIGMLATDLMPQLRLLLGD
jgi:hydroxyethylthiazole kinase-like uncharacterized protein yjeF